MVAFAEKMPDNAQVVVRTDGSARTLYFVLVLAAVLQVVLLLVAYSLVRKVPPAVLFFLMFIYAIQVAVTVPMLREYQARFGPQLAADRAGVWVRTGLGKRPDVVFLPWQAIDGIDVILKGPCLRILSRQGEALYTERTNWRLRSVRRRFGSAFVVHAGYTVEDPAQLAHRLHQLGMQATGA